jgi:hypothetical protein
LADVPQRPVHNVIRKVMNMFIMFNFPFTGDN